jgi:DNA-binding response OmpR family regulator
MMLVCFEGMATMVTDNSGHPSRPRLLLGYTDSAYAARSARHFRRLGWEVHLVAAGTEAERRADELRPHTIVLDADLPDASGWQSAAKILLTQPAQRIFLLVDEPNQRLDERAASLGIAGLVRRDQGPEALTMVLHDRQLSVAV